MVKKSDLSGGTKLFYKNFSSCFFKVIFSFLIREFCSEYYWNQFQEVEDESSDFNFLLKKFFLTWLDQKLIYFETW